MGALRVSKLAAGLVSQGWSPTVVTVEPRGTLYTKAGSLDVPDVVPVVRTPDRSLHHWVLGARPGKSVERKASLSRGGKVPRLAYALYRGVICFPDEIWPWFVRDYTRIRNITEAMSPDVILTSSPPNTCHMIGNRLSRDLDIPWVAEFRDLWTQNHLAMRAWGLRRLERALERRTLRRATALITVSQPLAVQLRALHRKPVYVIPSGFDPRETTDGPVGSKGLVLTYTGMIYPDRRDPRPLFDAAARLVREGVIASGEMEMRFFGRNMEHVSCLLEEFPTLKGFVFVHGEISHDEALEQQELSTVLLLLEWVDERARGVYTGKLFEYLGAHRPILAVAGRGSVIEALLQETGAGQVVTCADEAYLVLKAWTLSLRAIGRAPIRRDEKAVRGYTWLMQAQKLAKVLGSAIDS
jgi:hypothetical protein